MSVNNTELLSRSYDEAFDLYQARFQTISSNLSGSLFDDIWLFERSGSGFDTGKQPIRLDFSIFDNSEHFVLPQEFNLLTPSGAYTGDFKLLAKLLFLEGCNTVYTYAYSYHFSCLTKYLGYISETLKKEKVASYKGLFEFAMTRQYSPSKGFLHRLKPYKYNSAIAYLRDQEYVAAVKMLGLSDWPLTRISKEKWTQQLNKTCLDVLDITYDEYRDGGSYNFLTLDYGRHYFDYLGSVIEKNISVSIALNKVADDYDLFCQKYGRKVGSRGVHHDIYLRVLKGVPIDEIKESLIKVHFKAAGSLENSSWPNKLAEMQRWCQERFASYLIESTRQYALFSEDNLKKLAKSIDFKINFNSIQALKHLVYLIENETLGQVDNTLKAENVYQEIKQTYCDSSEISYSRFEQQLNELKDVIVDKLDIPQLNESFYRSFNLDLFYHSKSPVSALSSSIECALKTLVASITGWRRSEFGFAMNDITLSRNADSQDSAIHPIRFIVKWFVPKTNGETKLNREMTIDTYMYLDMLRALTGRCDNDSIFGLKRKSSLLGNVVYANWLNFYLYYKPFVTVRELKKLNDLSEEKRAWARLSFSKDFSYSDCIDSEKVIEKSYRYCKAISLVYSKGQFSTSNLIRKYKAGNLPLDVARTWDEALSPELKEHILSSDLEDSEQISDLVRLVSSAFLGEIVYPTPHALRHCWAEAVYRRFTGDVGWFIRSNFKHLNGSFFMRYLRNKMMRSIDEIAKRNFVSSLVARHIRGQSEGGQYFAGRLDAYLRRIGKNLRVAAPSEVRSAAEDLYDNEIVDVKANDWGICILRRRAMNKAKCADGGVPQRHKAGISLCFGCSNNLIDIGHVEGIMIHIATDVTVVTEPDLPFIFKKEGVSNIKKALRQLVAMRANSGDSALDVYINHLKDALEQVREEVIDVQYT